MPMDQIFCEIDLDEESSFHLLCQLLGGTCSQDAIHFDNHILQGEIIKSRLNQDISIRKWKCTPHQRIVLRKMGKPLREEKEFHLFYFLQPATCYLKSLNRKLKIKRSRNNILFSLPSSIDFHLIPKEPFHLFEISFTSSWLSKQLSNASADIKLSIIDYIEESTKRISIEPFTVEEYKILHELETCLLGGNEVDFFLLSRAYNLMMHFFTKIINRGSIAVVHSGVHYDQIIEAEAFIMKEIKKAPAIERIASKVNMSVPSLVRKFRLIHGKSIYEYYIAKKMGLARKMICEYGVPIREAAQILGYNQPSAFIETFNKQFGYTPGHLKLMSKKFSFF